MNYKGWCITYNEARPVIGRWKAERYGVSICAGKEEVLKDMIDQRIKDLWAINRKVIRFCG